VSTWPKIYIVTAPGYDLFSSTRCSTAINISLFCKIVIKDTLKLDFHFGTILWAFCWFDSGNRYPEKINRSHPTHPAIPGERSISRQVDDSQK